MPYSMRFYFEIRVGFESAVEIHTAPILYKQVLCHSTL